MIAVFEEMFGAGLFWAMVATAVIITLAYVYVLIRDKRVGMRKFLIAQLFHAAGRGGCGLVRHGDDRQRAQ